jgi:hypothetical protein
MTTGLSEAKVGSLTPEMLSPALAIEAGYNYYVKEVGEPNSSITQSAAIAVAQFEELISQFPTNSPGGLYCFQLRLAANSLAKGIARCKEQLRKQQKAADEELQQVIVEMTQNEKVAGRARAIWNTLLAGGVVYFFTQTIFGVALHDQKGSNVQTLTLAIALAFTLVWTEFRGWLGRRSKRRMFASYKQALQGADVEYQRRAQEEYRLSAHLAEMAWVQMTTLPPPVTDGFKTLLKGAVTNWSPEARDSAEPVTCDRE